MDTTNACSNVLTAAPCGQLSNTSNKPYIEATRQCFELPNQINFSSTDKVTHDAFPTSLYFSVIKLGDVQGEN